MRLFSRSLVRYFSSLLRGGDGELEVLCLRIAAAHRDHGRLRPQPFVPRGDLIGPWIETRDRELPVRLRHRVEGMAEDSHVGAHPRMSAYRSEEHTSELQSRL